MKVHVTQCKDCSRKLWHQLKGSPKSPPHFYSIKGILTHSAIEKCITDEPMDNLEYPALVNERNKDSITKELYDVCMPEVARCMENFSRWVQSTEIPIYNMKSEERQTMQYKGLELTGTPDLYDFNTLVDFKTGKALVRAEYSQQLSAYDWILTQQGKMDTDPANKKHVIVFFGEDGPVEKVVTKQAIKEGTGEFFKNLDALVDNVKLIEEGGMPKCDLGFHCTFCEYRGVCSGI